MERNKSGAPVPLEPNVQRRGVGVEDEAGALALGAAELVDLGQGARRRRYFVVGRAVDAAELRAHGDVVALGDVGRPPRREAHRVAVVGAQELVRRVPRYPVVVQLLRRVLVVQVYAAAVHLVC